MSDSTQLSDQFAYVETISNDPPISVSKHKRVVSVRDNNGTQYTSGRVEIDASTALKGANGMANFEEMYITVPYRVSMKNIGANALRNPPTKYCATLKCGVWNVINSIRLELNGREVLTGKEYQNHWANVRAMTEWSQQEVDKHGSDAFLYPDDWFSCAFSSEASQSGDGFVYNRTNSGSVLGYTPTSDSLNGNTGFIKRLLANPIPIELKDGSTDVNTYGWPTISSSASSEIAKLNNKGAFKTGVITANEIAGEWFYLLKIRLCDLHPIFKSLKLMGNPQVKLTLEFNTGFVDIASGGGESPNMSIDNVVNRGKTCPIMVSSALADEPMAAVLSDTGGATNAKSIRLAYGVCTNDVASDIPQYYNTPYVELHLPFYDLQPSKLSKIISSPMKQIRFLDCYTQYITNQAGIGRINGKHGVNFQVQLGGSFKNIKYTLLLPYSQTSNNTIDGLKHFNTKHDIQQFESPFDASPWTQQAGSAIRSFNVMIGNEQVFTGKTMSYDHELWNQEVSKLNALNGGVSRAVNNGLLDLKRYSTIHRFLVADCSRVSNPDVVQSVQISGTNEASQGTNLLCIVVYERVMDVNLLTGEVLNVD